MKRILLVADDQELLLSLTAACREREEFALRTAGNGPETTAAIATDPGHLVVTDLAVPEMDSLELLALLHEQHPSIPMIILDSRGELKGWKSAGCRVLTDSADPASVLTAMEEALAEGAGVGHLPLAACIRLIHIRRRDCTLKVDAGKHAGILYFEGGELINAFSGALGPEEAAREILGWRNTSFTIQSTCTNQERLIASPLPELLAITGGSPVSSRPAIPPDPPSPPPTETAELPEASPEVSAPAEVDEIDDLGFVFPNLSPRASSAAQPAAKPQQPIAPSPAAKPTAEIFSLEDFSGVFRASATTPRKGPTDQLLDLIHSFDGIQQVVFISRTGRLLHRENIHGQGAAFLGYVAVAAEQIKGVLGSAGLRVALLECASGESLVLLAGPRLLVGLGLAAGTDPGRIAEAVYPVVDRITLEEGRKKNE